VVETGAHRHDGGGEEGVECSVGLWEGEAEF
jgi:hypothetical protein